MQTMCLDDNVMQGYNGSQLWDTAFAVQAIISTNIAEEYGQTLRKAHEYIKDSQVLSGKNLFYCILKIVLIIFRKGIIVITRKEHFIIKQLEGHSMF